MNLFIPRKTNLVGGTTTIDAQHLEKVLMDNFLAIERWANQQSVSCCIAQSTQKVQSPSYGTATGPWTVQWDQYQLADTANNRIRVPEAGIYIGFGSADILPGAPATLFGQGGIVTWGEMAITGGTSFMTPSFFQAWDSGIALLSTDNGISSLGEGHMLASFPFSASTAGYLTTSLASNSTLITTQVTAFGFVRINNIPSKTQ